ncbi:MAG: metallophosphoesterase [Nannocystis sp.]|nr:metallophosphoesterase [Nannocystis sp.]
MTQFDPNRTYNAERDVRPNPLLLARLRDSKPEGCLWALVGSRRSGKSWALSGLYGELLRGGLPAAKVKLVDVKSKPLALFSGSPTHLLLDEPGELLVRDPQRLLERSAELKDRGCKTVVAMTPSEWSRLTEAGRGQVHVRDRLVLAPLNADQAARMAARAPWAAALLPQLASTWSRNPFVLELLLSEAEARPELRALERLHNLYEQVIERAIENQTDYFHFVFDEGLANEHRQVLRALVRGEAPRNAEALGLLRECGLVDRSQGVVGDPILARLLRPPVIVHHVSDVHFGSKAATVVDAKVNTGPNKPYGPALGPATAADGYREHIEAIAGRGQGPHVLIVSGDLAERATEAEFRDARQWLDTLDRLCRAQAHPDLASEPRVLLTGGNHDVDWGKARASDPSHARHEAFARAFDGYVHPHLEQPPEDRPLALVSFAAADFDVLLLGSSEFGGQDDPRMRELADELWRGSSEAFQADNVTAYQDLRGELERVDPSLVHERTLKAIRGRPCRSAVRIAVLHHPLTTVPGVLTVARFSGLLNAGAVKDALLTAGVQLVLHGHEHSAFVAIERWPGRHDGELRIASAPSLGSREVAEQRGYNEICITVEGVGRVDVSIQTVVQSGNAWERRGEPVVFRVTK